MLYEPLHRSLNGSFDFGRGLVEAHEEPDDTHGLRTAERR